MPEPSLSLPDSPVQRPRTLGDVSLFSGIPGNVLADLDDYCRWSDVSADTLVIDSFQSIPHGVFVLVEGEVDIYRLDHEARRVDLGHLPATSCFGEFAAINGTPGSASVRTTTPCLLAEIAPEAFMKFLTDCPALSLGLLKKAVSHIRKLDEDIVRLRATESRIDKAYCQAVVWAL